MNERCRHRRARTTIVRLCTIYLMCATFERNTSTATWHEQKKRSSEESTRFVEIFGVMQRYRLPSTGWVMECMVLVWCGINRRMLMIGTMSTNTLLEYMSSELKSFYFIDRELWTKFLKQPSEWLVCSVGIFWSNILSLNKLMESEYSFFYAEAQAD